MNIRFSVCAFYIAAHVQLRVAEYIQPPIIFRYRSLFLLPNFSFFNCFSFLLFAIENIFQRQNVTWVQYLQAPCIIYVPSCLPNVSVLIDTSIMRRAINNCIASGIPLLQYNYSREVDGLYGTKNGLLTKLLPVIVCASNVRKSFPQHSEVEGLFYSLATIVIEDKQYIVSCGVKITLFVARLQV